MSGPWASFLSFRRSSSSVDLATCPSSRASLGESSKYLIMHNIPDLGSNHVSRGSYGISLRKEVTSDSRALARARVIGPIGVVGDEGRSMGMTVGCSASDRPGSDTTVGERCMENKKI